MKGLDGDPRKAVVNLTTLASDGNSSQFVSMPNTSFMRAWIGTVARVFSDRHDAQSGTLTMACRINR
jgi:hypothetical protein